MKQIFTLLFLALSINLFAQPVTPKGVEINGDATWNGQINKAQGDSCGVYYNNYIGIHKTVVIREEPMRTGNAVETGHYNGRAQRFNAPQAIEVSGVEFFAYIKNNPTMDSIMVITSLNQYDAFTDSVGVEIVRDTVYVTHHSFTLNIPNLSIQSVFDAPVTMNNDYVVSIFTPTDDSLYILANNPFDNAGNGENLGHALYDNSNFPSFTGWYSMLGDFAFDYDFMIAPLVKFDLHESFNVVNDTICPGIAANGCVSYAQEVIYNNNQYNSNSASSTNSIFWNWDDGTFNTALTSACHTYNNSGTYNINLKDTLFKWDYVNSICAVDITNPILALDSVIPSFSFIQTNSTVDFTNTTTGADSVWWEFGDSNVAGNENTPSHFYSTIGTYDVWLHAINDCTEDSIMIQVTTDDVGLDVNSNDNISMFPNPANAMVTFLNVPTNSTVNVFNIIGENLKLEIESNQNEILLNTELLNSGTYIVKIQNIDRTITKKLVVKH